jgi:myo-inositol-1(or 4)-monophosphatase
MELKREVAAAEELARDIGFMVKTARTTGITTRSKAHGEIVTTADLQANAAIEARLRTLFPGDAIYSEESPDDAQRLSQQRVWIVDPIDSTSSFAAGGDEFTISIGLAVNGRAALGVVYNPARDELYSGATGAGAALNGRSTRVSEASHLEIASILVSKKEWQKGLEALELPFRAIPMSSMAYKLARVAAGMNDGVFTLKRRKEWGTCAGAALVTAAGGDVSLIDGTPMRFNRAEQKQPAGFVASGNRLHAELLRVVHDVANIHS